MSAGHAETFALLTAIRGDVDDAGPLASQVGAEDVDRETGFGRDDRDAMDVVGWKERIGRAVGQQLVGNLGDATVARGHVIILAAGADGGIGIRVDAAQPSADVVVDWSDRGVQTQTVREGRAH
jgi:hypothetical protein